MKMQNMLREIFFLVTLKLSLQVLQNQNKIIIRDIKGLQGINDNWEKVNTCNADYWLLTNYEISTCYKNGDDDITDCSILSLPYDVRNVSVLFVNVKTDTRTCVSRVGVCLEQFELLLTNENKTFIEVLPRNKLPNENSENFFTTDDTVQVALDKRYSQIRLGFRRKYFCGTIKSISAFYYECPAVYNELIRFDKVTTPRMSDGVTTFEGKCIENASPQNIEIPLSMKCYPNGRFEVSGRCFCQPGHQLKNGICEAVIFQCPARRGVLVDFPANSNQNTTSNVIKVIGKCTENSIPDANRNPYMECYKNGSTEIFGECKCIEGYLVINNYCQNAPVLQNLTKTNNDDGSVTLKWNLINEGMIEYIKYIVEYGDKKFILLASQKEFRISAGYERIKLSVKIHLQMEQAGNIYKGPVSTMEVTLRGGVSLSTVALYGTGIIVFITVLYITFLLIYRGRIKSQLKANQQNEENKDVNTKPEKTVSEYVSLGLNKSCQESYQDLKGSHEQTASEYVGLSLNILTQEKYQDLRAHKEMPLQYSNVDPKNGMMVKTETEEMGKTNKGFQ